jgi:hypothetical protein
MRKLFVLIGFLTGFAYTGNAQILRDHHQISLKNLELPGIILPESVTGLNQKTVPFKAPGIFSPGSLVWQFDTIVTYDTIGMKNRIIRTYNASGNPLVQLIELWQNNAWVNGARYTYSYDASGNLITFIYSVWEGSWQDYQMISYTYDANGNNLTYLSQYWEENAWKNFRKSIYGYDLNGKMISGLALSWDTTNTWVNSYRWTTTYDNNGYPSGEIYETWQSNLWVNMWNDTYVYDASGNMLSYLEEQWVQGAWVNVWKEDLTYDPSGHLSTMIAQLWTNNAWELYEQVMFTHDANANMVMETDQTRAINTWQNTSRKTYTYDEHGNSVTGMYESWVNNNWHQDNGYLYLYTSVSSLYSFTNIYRYEAGYTSYLNGIGGQQETAGHFTLFPNPAKDLAIVNYPDFKKAYGCTITICDLQGKLIKSLRLSGELTEIDVAGLPGGIYAVRLASPGGTWVQKLIKQ